MIKILILVLAILIFTGCGSDGCNPNKFQVGDRVRIKGIPISNLVITQPGYCAVGLGSGVKGNMYIITNQLGETHGQWEYMLEKIDE